MSTTHEVPNDHPNLVKATKVLIDHFKKHTGKKISKIKHITFLLEDENDINTGKKIIGDLGCTNGPGGYHCP